MRKPVDGDVGHPFDELRPFGSPNPYHVHGAVDIGADIGVDVVAPETGRLRAYLAIRYKGATYWPEKIVIDRQHFPYLNYFYDMFGGILVLRSMDGRRTHAIAHCYGNQLFDKGPFASANLHWIEEKMKTRWPIHAVYTDEVRVAEGHIIGQVGDAGTSTAPHIHWEIHNRYRLNDHSDRIDPERWLRGEFTCAHGTGWRHDYHCGGAGTHRRRLFYRCKRSNRRLDRARFYRRRVGSRGARDEELE